MSTVDERVAVLFISGQSNAHGHGQRMTERDYINEPLRNVFSLDRNPNQSLDITDVVWSGFTTEGKNLGETQDNTYNFAYFFAKLWQGAIDRGETLPDLYIVQMSVGSQGIINGMWNPDKEKVLVPGTHLTSDISLFPFALHVNKLVMSNLKNSGKEPLPIGWHWLGSEQDVLEGGFDREDFESRYDYFFDEMLRAIGEPCPLYLYKVYLERFCHVNNFTDLGIPVVNRALERQCIRHNGRFILAEECPYWDETDVHKGIYDVDDGHYLGKMQEWFAERFYAEIIDSLL